MSAIVLPFRPKRPSTPAPATPPSVDLGPEVQTPWGPYPQELALAMVHPENIRWLAHVVAGAPSPRAS